MQGDEDSHSGVALLLPCNSMKYADGNVNYTCSSLRKVLHLMGEAEVFCHLSFFRCLYTCISSSNQIYYMQSLAYTSEKVLFSPHHNFYFLSIPFSLMTLSHTLETRHTRERKIRAVRRCQCLVFRQTLSTHNRDIS